MAKRVTLPKHVMDELSELAVAYFDGDVAATIAALLSGDLRVAPGGRVVARRGSAAKRKTTAKKSTARKSTAKKSTARKSTARRRSGGGIPGGGGPGRPRGRGGRGRGR